MTVRVAVAIACAALAAACATPASRIDGTAMQRGYERLVLRGTEFEHVAYSKPGAPGTGGASLHVYIEHDGTPWSTPTTPASDPTPTRPLALELMREDDAPALYLGRPCYFGFAREPPCEPIWWTHRRYSQRVVDSMAAALGRYLASHPEFETLQFYGYSGGGVIAALMTGAFPRTVRLVTVAAPLDTEGWTALHGYAPLDGSLSPLRQPPLRAGIAQLHLVGGADDVVPATLVLPFVARQDGAEFRSIGTFTHYCCWEKVWKDTIRPWP
jgi:hypothetical protein